MRLTALQLRQAGFDEDTVLSFVENQRPILKKAGFSDYDINKEFGIQPIKSQSLISEDYQDANDGFGSQKLLGNKSQLENNRDNQTAKDVEQDKAKKNRNNTIKTFDLLKQDDQKRIINRIDEAYKLFDKQSDGKGVIIP